MLEELIHYLVDLPTPTTAPLYLVVNTTAVLTAHASSLTEIPVIDTMPADPNKTAAFVRLYDTGRRSPYGRSIGGSNGSYTEYQYLKIDYVCQGDTKYQALSRAGDLRRVVETALEYIRGQGLPAGALTRTNPNGSGYDKITNWRLANSNNPERPPKRIGGLDARRFSATKNTTLEVVVTHHP